MSTGGAAGPEVRSRGGAVVLRSLVGATALAVVAGLSGCTAAGPAAQQPEDRSASVEARGRSEPGVGRTAAPTSGPHAVDDNQNYSHAQIRDLRRQAQALLDARADAVREGDRRAFLADVDPGDAALRARQRRYFANLVDLPVKRIGWRVEKDEWPARYFTAKEYRDTAYVPFVDSYLQLRGFDRMPVHDEIGLTFAPRPDGELMLVGDRDVRSQLSDGAGERPWDVERVIVRRAGRLLVLFDQRSIDQAPQILEAVQRAAGTARRSVPFDWNGHVVVYALGNPEVIRNVDTDIRVGIIGALAFAVPSGGRGGGVAAYRFLINPKEIDTPEPGLTRLVTHEMAHVAIGGHDAFAPTWLTEGIAEWVSAQDLPYDQVLMPSVVVRRAEREGADHLPTSANFNGAGQTWNYGLSWYACEWITDRFGDERLFTLLRRVEKVEQEAVRQGRPPGGPALAEEIRRTLGVGPNALARLAADKIAEEY